MVDLIYDTVNINELFSDWQFHITNISGRNFISPDVNSVEWNGADGSRFIGSRIPAREIKVDFTLVGYCPSVEQSLETKLMSTVYSYEDYESVLEFSDRADRYYKAILSDVSVTENWTSTTGTLTFLCANPFSYGLPVDKAYATTIDLSEDTNFNVEPVWELTLLESAPTSFDFVCNNRTLRIYQPMSSGTTIKIDTQRKEAYVNNTLTVLTLYGEFPLLFKGENTLSTNVAVSGTVEYLQRWL